MQVYITDNIDFIKRSEYFDPNSTVIIVAKSGITMPKYNKDIGEALDLRADKEVKAMLSTEIQVPLGVKWYAPMGVFLLIIPRSSSHKKYNIRLANTVGLIDSSYRNEIIALIEPHDISYPVTINRGDRIVQGLILQTATVDSNPIKELYIVRNNDVFEHWEEIMASKRKGGIGWTGIK